VLNQRLQKQLATPDPAWTPVAERALQGTAAEIARKSGGRVRIVEARCGTDVCQVLAMGLASDDNRGQGWGRTAMPTLLNAPWFRELGFADATGMTGSSADGRVMFHVVQITAAPRR
jgi:hypothetical protein